MAKIILSKIQWARKILFKAIAIGKRPDLSLSPTQLKQRVVGFLRAVVRGSCRPSMFANWFYPKEK